MDFLLSIVKGIKFSRSKARKTIANYKEEQLLKHGAEQFKTLVKKGLGIPVVML